MSLHIPKKDRNAALRIVSIYVFFSCLWIFLSDRLLVLVVRDPDLIARYSNYKGFLFVAVTGTLIYRLIDGYIQGRERAEEDLRRLNEQLEVRVAKRTEELESSRVELELQHEQLQETYLDLEAEAEKRIEAMEELQARDRMMIQQSRMAAMGEMLGNIAHHWRQPLNLLGLKVQQLGILYEMNQFSEDLLKSNVKEVMVVLKSLSDTIDDFRSLSLPETEKSRFDVEGVLGKTVSVLRENFKEQLISIEVDAAEGAQIYGYANEYAQALLNILMNARDALLEQGTQDARITISSRLENGRSVVTISDNAGGIPEMVLDKIFDPYFTTKDLGKGSGVGLFMAKTIIEKNMGGLLTACNRAGGAQFRIEV